jgi:hypothetical protein
VMSSPYESFVRLMIQEGWFGCAGEFDLPAPGHGTFDPHVILRPLMDYTFDIEMAPSESPEGEIRAITPLFRRSFRT